jgi:hypothetical protein
LHSWTDDEAIRLQEFTADKEDKEPKALCCYGLLRFDSHRLMLRFVDGRPISRVTTAFLEWSSKRLGEEGKKAMLLVWDNASWHISQEVRSWIKSHNREAKRSGGVRILVCQLPVKSPWLNPIEAKWVHGKRAVVEPGRKLTAEELIGRVCDYYGCEHLPHLKQNLS